MSDKETTMTINGQALTEDQILTVRVALNTFASTLESIGLGEDELGTGMADSYLSRIQQTLDLMGPP